MYIHMSHFDTRPQMIGVSTAFRFQNPTTSNISKPFNSQHHSRHFQLQLLCISISVLTLCPPNSQFGHFHVLPCGGTRCVSKGKTRQHWINGYSWRWGGMPSCNLRKGDFERNCVGHFDLTMIFCFFSLHVICVYFGSSFKGIERSIKESHLFLPSLEGGSFSGCLQELGSLVFAVESQGVESQLITKCSRGFNQ